MTEQRGRDFLTLLDRYWQLAFAEGRENRTHDTPNGDAQEAISAILAYVETLEKLLGEVLACHDEGAGLLDCIDNKGGRYTSRHLYDTIQATRAALEAKP